VRLDANATQLPVSTTEQQAAVDRFLAAVRKATCRASSMCSRPMSSSLPTAAAWSPRRADRSRVPERVAAFLMAAARSTDFVVNAVWLTGHLQAGSTSTVSSTPRSALPSRTVGSTRIYAIRNPHKLAGLDGVQRTHSHMTAH